MRYLAIEEALQIYIKDILAHNNKSYVQWCDISDEKRNKNKVNSLLHMIWDGRRDHMAGYIIPMSGMLS